jgi:catalase
VTYAGFAVKFYTKEGNWDLVGNNIPVFFIQDAIKFPDLIHAVKMEPDRGFPQSATAHDTFWDFISLTPESMHMVMWIMSDRTIPRSLRMIEGFGVHSFRLINDAGESTFVKFHWRPKLGLQSTIWDETVKISGADQDFHRRDMFEAIEAGNFPEWEFAVQLFTQEEADEFPFDHLDATKLIPEELVPLKVIGRMVLDRWPNNFFAETEQVAYCPSISCRASISRMIHCCKAVCSPIIDTQLRAWVHPISTRSRSTRPSARSATINATDTCRWRNRWAVLRMSPTPCLKTRRAKRRPRAFIALR